ncbi:MAG TPA: bifunctional diaminohydroxyphosphoribosylaminopyrimidine deaminase/5-amino-6-(5-phosphoribosylamino)uracil reductase RibD [Dehalococcoidia bacterium]|nr:bifunctional diaminohydroxyphosphoribosylaminopyrimidine deaminase/5-amino-6-(5-phosphoribosylamino)uracil reductase RibD [Dehalococcoidia bacterium]
MARALELAWQALGQTSPNPAVGAVVVKDGQVVGEGHTQPPGSAHAEVVALRQAGEKAQGASLYITLEPCCHFGRTPPCTQAVIGARLREVHIATLDPNPQVSGRGKAELERAGIKTHIGEYEAEAKEVTEAYSKYITSGLPFVTAKFAMSLDGKIATHSGDSKWISCPESRDYAHLLRHRVDAILVGVNTIVRDDPQLTPRPPGAETRPKPRIIVDSLGQTPLTARVFREPGPVWLAVAGPLPQSQVQALSDLGVEILRYPSATDRVDLPALLQELGRRQITSLLVEGGSTILGSFFDLGLVDKVVAFIAPIIVGGKNAVTAVAGEGVAQVAKAWQLRGVKVERLGTDLMVSGYPQRPG